MEKQQEPQNRASFAVRLLCLILALLLVGGGFYYLLAPLFG